MNKRLIVQLIIHPDGRLIAVDNSDYNSIGVDIEEHVMVDFLVYNEDSIPVENTLSIKYDKLNRGYYRSQFTTEYMLPKDGIYSYYKLVIPILQHFVIGENTYSHNIQDQLFYYKQSVRFFDKELNQDSYTLEEVLENSVILDDCLEWYDVVHNNHASQTFYLPAKKIFSVYKLNKCLAYFQKQLLGVNNPCKNLSCETRDVYRRQRDLLFGAMYVFDYLKDVGNYTEAQRILENLSSCDSLCSDILPKIDCGCGNSL